MKSADQLLDIYRRKGALIDSNILLLAVIGTFNIDAIGRTDRLSGFDTEDYQLLMELLARFTTVATTPHILTEVSNLSSGIPDHHRSDYFAAFARTIEVLLSEEQVVSKDALRSEWRRFGLTDAAIALAASGRYLVITDDFKLSQSLQSADIDAINFNHLRDVYWQLNG